MTQHYDTRPFPLTTTELREFVRSEVHKALYALLKREEVDIDTMSLQEFEAFCERVTSEVECD